MIVYTFPNGFAQQAESMYGWLRHYGLSPSWGDCSQGSMTIRLPPAEVAGLRLLQQHDPARWGNPPERQP